MAEQIQHSKPTTTTTAPPTEQVEAPQAVDNTTKGDKLKGELDALLDEIDEALEENAEEFVKGYIQKGGE